MATKKTPARKKAPASRKPAAPRGDRTRADKTTRQARSPREGAARRKPAPRAREALTAPDRPAGATTMGLHDLRPARGATHKRKRIGRGPGSGHGKTAGRGNKGFWSRSGSSQKRGFEGGQMPLHRRVPKRGFTNIFRKEFSEVNVDTLAARFAAGATVGPDELRSAGIVHKILDGLKVLGRGEIAHALIVKAHRFSAEARRKIEAAGGTVEVL